MTKVTELEFMSEMEAITALHKLTGRDVEVDHGDADEILLRVLNGLGAWGVAVAWQEACERCGFWYA